MRVFWGYEKLSSLYKYGCCCCCESCCCWAKTTFPFIVLALEECGLGDEGALILLLEVVRCLKAVGAEASEGEERAGEE